jgi:hypothetical protein
MAYDPVASVHIDLPAGRAVDPRLRYRGQIKASSVANEVTDGRRKRRPTSHDGVGTLR